MSAILFPGQCAHVSGICTPCDGREEGGDSGCPTPGTPACPQPGARGTVLNMSDTQIVTVSQKGRVVIPAAIRSRHGWEEGTELLAVDTQSGVTLLPRDNALALVRQQLAGPSLARELIAERRAEAAQDQDPT